MSQPIKVLPLDSPFTCDKEYWEECVEEKNRIKPVFNRNGYYYNRYTKTSWLEINGEAWKYYVSQYDKNSMREHYQYALDISIGNNRMMPEVFNAIGILMKNRAASREQKHKYYIERDMRGLREIYINSAKGAYARFKAFKKKLKLKVDSA